MQVAFERKDGTMFQNEAEEMPFDYSGSKVVIDDIWTTDSGILMRWIILKDIWTREIEFTAKYCASAESGSKYFVPGRHIMTCCEEDIQFLGFVCYFEGNIDFKHEDWIRVNVKFDYRYCDMYGEEGPVLKLLSISEETNRSLSW